MKIVFLGDISFNCPGCSSLIIKDDFDSHILPSDFIVGNLEALVSTGDYNCLKRPRVTVVKEDLGYLANLNVRLVTLAHNHVYDGLKSGFDATVEKLDSLGINYIGAGYTIEEASRPFILRKNGLSVGFLNYCSEDTNPNLPLDCQIFLNIYHPEKVLSDITELKQKVDHVILLLHWGGKFEGGYFPDNYQIQDSKAFINAGVSAIVGHHPHTLQPRSLIGNAPIYYSLGNFIFYDIVFENQIIKLSPRRRRGGVLSLTFSADKLLEEKLLFSNFNNFKLIINSFNFFHLLRQFIFSYFGRFYLFEKIYIIQFKYLNPLLYFIFIQSGGLNKFRKLNITKIKNYIWKK